MCMGPLIGATHMVLTTIAVKGPEFILAAMREMLSLEITAEDMVEDLIMTGPGIEIIETELLPMIANTDAHLPWIMITGAYHREIMITDAALPGIMITDALLRGIMITDDLLPEIMITGALLPGIMIIDVHLLEIMIADVHLLGIMIIGIMIADQLLQVMTDMDLITPEIMDMTHIQEILTTDHLLPATMDTDPPTLGIIGGGALQ